MMKPEPASYCRWRVKKIKNLKLLNKRLILKINYLVNACFHSNIEHEAMKRILLPVLLLLTACPVFAQTTLKFCAQVYKDGSCKGRSTDFTISMAGGTITFLIKNNKGLGTTKVAYKIFRVTEDGQEHLNNTIEQNIQPKWNYAWEEAVFYDPGTYKVLVYDQSDQGPLICLGIVKIFTQ